MNSTRSARLLALVWLVPIELLALADAAQAGAFVQRTDEILHDEDDSRIEERELFVSVVLEGIVLGPDGAPAANAVVVSSAGGQAVTDQDGAYRLEVEAPLEAESVQVTVVQSRGGGSLTASTSVSLSASRTTRVEPLLLALATTCQSSWLPTFGSLPGVYGAVYHMTVFDDGSGPALYAGGQFTVAGDVEASNIARWNGSSWSALGSGVFYGGTTIVRDMAVFDDGSGPALYVTGALSTAGGVTVNHIARWDGSSWSALGSGLNDFGDALEVFDNGSGPALYVGGTFTRAGGMTTNRAARWNGSSWSVLGGVVFGTSGRIHELTVFDDGSGPALYAGGSNFAAAGHIARWTGSSWSALGTGVNSAVFALTVFDDGSGPALYAGGIFTFAGGATASRIARWKDSVWTALSSGMNNTVNALAVFDDGSGPALHAAGLFTTAGGATAKGIAKWDGSSWSALTSDTTTCISLAVHDDGSGPALYVGSHVTAGDVMASGIARWDGSTWSALGTGRRDEVHSLIVFDDGSGPALYSGSAIEWPTNRVAKWSGSGWSELGSGMTSPVMEYSDIKALAFFDAGSGPELYAGGSFATADGVTVNRIARWNGSSWTALGSGVSGGISANTVNALAVHDDGSGPALYAGGDFVTASGVTVNRIARWNGSSWSALGSGMNGIVHALTVLDDGSGAALYAGGAFTTAGGVTANRIARWNGSSWSAVGAGMNSSVHALTVFDAGSGPALYAGGMFTMAGIASASRIARWNGSNWSALGSGMNGSSVSALASLDDGSGPALFAGGQFTTAGGTAANRIAKWNGSSWSPLGSGMNGIVRALVPFDDGSGPALYAGGSFQIAYDSGDSYIAKWGCDTTPPTLTCPTSVFADGPFTESASEGTVRFGAAVTFEVTASDDVDPAPSVVCTPPSGSLFPRGTTLVTCTATDDAGNQSTCTFPVTVQLRKRWR